MNKSIWSNETEMQQALSRRQRITPPSGAFQLGEKMAKQNPTCLGAGKKIEGRTCHQKASSATKMAMRNLWFTPL
jgi:hypothetical protein